MKKSIKIYVKVLSLKHNIMDKIKKIVDKLKSEDISLYLSKNNSVNSISALNIVLIDDKAYKDIYRKKDIDSEYIILITSNTSPDYINQAYENGIFEILQYPLIEKEVFNKLKFITESLVVKNTDEILEIILDSIEDSIAITDSEGKLEYVNKGFLNISGYNYDEVIGENPRVLKSDGHTDQFYENLWKTIKKGKVWNGDFINVNKNDEIYYEAASIYPINLNETKYLKIAHNIDKKDFFANKMKSSIGVAKNVLKSSAPESYSDKNIQFDYIIKYMNQLGGDFIWFDKIDDNRYFMSLIDVTGHDLSSTLIMMNLISFLKDFKNIDSIDILVEKINNYLIDFNKKSKNNKLISGIFCEINYNTKKINYINAGHPSGLLFSQGDLIQLKNSEMLLGVLDNLSHSIKRIKFDKRDKLVFYSDGILEYYLKDYSDLSNKAYKRIFYENDKFIYDKIKKNVKNEKYPKDDLSLACVRL
ncbi:MAG: SpoIIE family protein phosphatase [Bacillota bacterium]